MLLFLHGLNLTFAAALFLASIGYNLVINRKDIIVLFTTYIIAFAIFKLGYISNSIVSILFVVVIFVIILNRTRNWLLSTILASIGFSATTLIWYVTFQLVHALFPELSLGVYPYIYLPFWIFLLIELCLVGLYLLFSYTIRTANKKYQVIETFMKSDRNYYILSIVLMIAVTIIAIFHVYTFQEELHALYGIASFIGYLLILILAIGIGFFVIKNTNQTIYLHEKIAYALQLEEENKEVNYFKHDYKNILLTLSIFIKNNDMEGLRTYFFDELNNYSEELLENEDRLKALRNLDILPLKGLIIEKEQQARNLGINVDITISEMVQSIRVPIIKLVRCLSILLDNAIEESQFARAPQIAIDIIAHQNELIFQVKNSLANRGKTVSKNVMQAGYSTKGKGRGNGLASFERIINGLDNATYMMEQKDGAFTSYIFLTNK
ncbi:GHKL domain-containing protein [Listeria booriae]|uniref:GHKL domain-containing protein n=1 Tax=Listeria booriae TaxID=1552123 RepID=UPI001629A03E|nr:GHKL domain-containing protein [Listeria booriae]MBC2180447.1 GHKL domain-containing protein [Listeria booriae]